MPALVVDNFGHEISTEVEYEDISVRDIFKALEKNGFYHLRSEWEAEDVHGVITGGCVLQQGAMNLGVLASNDEEHTEGPSRYTLVDQLNKFRIRKGSKWDPNKRLADRDDNDNRNLGNVIVYWNDAEDIDDDGNSRWTLPTYDDVIDMAEEVMNPYFDKTIKLQKHHWEYKRKDSAS